MTGPDATRALAVFSEIIELAPTERAARLQQLAAGDDALLARVTAMLSVDASGSALIDQPLATLTATWSTPPVRDASGRFAGPYRLLHVVGRGGMGTVYRARRDDVDGIAAIKVVDAMASTAERIARFEQERRILARLDHPGIARFLDAGLTSDGDPWLAMEFVDGVPITSWCDEHHLTLPERLDLFEQLCEATAYAQGHGLVHRDIKPTNVLVSEGRARLLDFGIARLRDPARGAPLTRDAPAPLTPDYASPEQLRGEDANAASDVFQLGMILVELMIGVSPHCIDGGACEPGRRRENAVPQAPSRLLQQETQATQPGLRERMAQRQTTAPALTAQLDGALDTVAVRALQPDPATRYPDAEALLVALRGARRGEPVDAPPSRRIGPRWRLLSTRRRVTAAVAVVGTVVALAAGGRALVDRRLAQERARASALSASLQRLVLAADPTQRAGDTSATRAVLRRLVDEGRRGLATDPRLWSQVLLTAADVYRSLGRADSSEALSREVVAQLDARGDAQHGDALLALGNLGIAAMETGQVAAGRAHLAALMDRVRTIDDERAFDAMLAHYKAAYAYASIGFVGEGRPLALRARQFVATLPESAALYRDRIDLTIATLSLLDHDAEGATRLFADVANRRERAYGRTHERTINALFGYASATLATGRIPKADTLAREVVDARRTLYGPVHRETAAAVRLRGEVELALGNAAGARRHALDALATLSELPLLPVAEVWRARELLALTYRAVGDTVTGNALLTTLLADIEASAGPQGAFHGRVAALMPARP